MIDSLIYLTMGGVIGFGLGWVAKTRRHIRYLKQLREKLSESMEPQELDRIFTSGRIVVPKSGRYSSH